MLFVYHPEVKMESSNLLVDMIESIVEFKMRVLQESLRVLSPNRRIFVTTPSLNSKMLQLLLLILSRRVILLFV